MPRWKVAPLLFYVASAILSLVYSLPRLSFSGDRSRLLESGHPVQQRYEEYRREFPDLHELIFLVHGNDPMLRQQAADWLAAELSKNPSMQYAFSRVDTPLWPSQGLYFLSPRELEHLNQRLIRQRPSLQAMALRDWSSLWRGGQDARIRQELERALQSRGREAYRSPWGRQPPELPRSVELAVNPQTSVVIANATSTLDFATVENWVSQGRSKFPQVHITPAGSAWAQADDARRGMRIAFQVTITSIFLVHLFFRRMFQEAKSARLALFSLAIGLTWTTAWVAWVSPQLNLITVNFAATLLGLGMDFHIQLLYRRTSCDSQGLTRALQETRWETLTGAAAVSLAFVSLTALPYLGVAQLGKITSMGVLLCWLASRTVFPFLISYFQPQLPARSDSALLAAEAWCWRHRVPLLAAALVVSLFSAVQARSVSFDGNLLHMFSTRSETVKMEKAFHAQAGHCGLFAISLAPDEPSMRERVASLEKLNTVARVESLAVWKPPHYEGHQKAVARVLGTFAQLPALGPPPRIDEKTMARLRRQRQQEGLRDSEIGPGPMQDALNIFLGALHDDLRGRLNWLGHQKEIPAPSWEQLPRDWVRQYFRGKSYQIRIYPKGDIWEPKQLQTFLDSLKDIDPQVTGLACVLQAFLQDLRLAYWEAGRNAMLAISVILLLHFRSLRLALWGLAPKLLGMLWMLGAMGWLGLSFNPANVTALPLTLGIGLMFGIQAVHAHCLNGHEPVDEAQVDPGNSGLFARGQGLPILVSGVSTILGYLSLCGADYPGVASLGIVMALGVGFNLLAALVFMPLIMGWPGK